MLKPPALRPGDRLALVAPASPFDRVRFDDGLAEIRSLGFEPVYDRSLFDRTHYVAGDPACRAQAIRDAWGDSSIAGVIAVRGGYGSVQVLPLLDPNDARRGCKVFVGCSDVTSMLVFLTGCAGLVSFHGPMVTGMGGPGSTGYDRESFVNCLMRPEPVGVLQPPGLETVEPGEARGLLLGGTLTQILASLGTPFAFDPPPGHVLFLDEVGERPYRLDRMLTQLALSGLLGRAAGVVFGQLPGCDEPGGALTARETVERLMRGFPGPVLRGFPSGHTTQPAVTLPFGVRVRVVADRQPCLVIEESAVR